MKHELDVWYQSWVGKGHGYKVFDLEEVRKEGNTVAIAKYENCLANFLALPYEQQARGIIYGHADYDFSFGLKGVVVDDEDDDDDDDWWEG